MACSTREDDGARDHEGPQNDAFRVAAEKTGVPRDWLMTVAYQQGQFETPGPAIEPSAGDPAEEDLDVPEVEDPTAVLEEDTVDDDPMGVETLEADPAEEAANMLGHENEAIAWGIMYLTDAQVTEGAALLGVDPARVKDDVGTNVLAAASLIERDWKHPAAGLVAGSDEALRAATVKFIGLEDAPEAAELLLEDLDGIRGHGFDVTTEDGERIELVGPLGPIDPTMDPVIPGDELGDGPGGELQPLALAAGNYPAIKWIPAPSRNYTNGRSGGRVRYVVIHDIEGSYSSGIRTFSVANGRASTHYVVGKDSAGKMRVAQMVKESNKAWHAGHGYYNANSIGIEHAGFADRRDGGGHYSAEYVISAQLTCAISKKYGIPVDRRHIVGHGNVPESSSARTLCSDARANVGANGCGGHSNHHDPGRYWNWSKYMGLVAKCRRGEPIDGSGSTPAPTPPPAPPAPPPIKFAMLPGDFDGDGKTDLVTMSANGKYGWAKWAEVELSRGTSFGSTVWSSPTPQHMRNGNKNADYRFLRGDFDGNGKTDVATLSPNAGGGWKDWLSVDLSTGSAFTSKTWAATTPKHMRNGGSAKHYHVVVGDFDGDGKSDVATISPDAGGGWANWVAVERSTGVGFKSETWAAATPQHMRNGGAGKTYRVYAADFNGDGKTDLATLSPDAGGSWSSWLAVELSTGTGFTSTTWAATTPKDMRNGGSGKTYLTAVLDVDGDGKSDLATVSPNAAGGWKDWVAVEKSLGTGFSSQRFVAALPKHMRNGGETKTYTLRAGDFDGNGTADLATVSTTGGGAWATNIELELSSGRWFTSSWRTAATPKHIRNGGATKAYAIFAGKFSGSRFTDLATVSQTGGGGWKSWFSMELPSASAFTSKTWTADLPERMREGD